MPEIHLSVDDEVLRKLGCLALVEGSPNLALRRLLDLPPKTDDGASKLHTVLGAPLEPVGTGEGKMHPGIAKLVKAADVPMEQVTLIRGSIYRLKNRNGKVVGNISYQNGKARVVVEASKNAAQRAELKDWSRELLNGWYQKYSSVFWYAPDGDADAAERVAQIIRRLSEA